MTKEQAKEFVRTQEPTFLPRAKNVGGRHSFVCPCCSNGSGKNGTGITEIPNSSSTVRRYKCFKCGESDDIVGLYQKAFGVDYGTCYKELYSFYEVQVDGEENDEAYTKRMAEIKSTPRAEEPHQVDVSEYIIKCHKNLDPEYLLSRGISIETQNHFFVGTDKEWKNPVTVKRMEEEGFARECVPSSPRCIIPTSRFSYLARDTRSHLSKSQERFSKQKFGRVVLFNGENCLYRDCFAISEGEIDAMSMYEACHVECIGLGSTSNWRILVSSLKPDEWKGKRVLLATDADKAGQACAEALKLALEPYGVVIELLDFSTIYNESKGAPSKDPNEALVSDRELFVRKVKEALTALQTKELNNEEKEEIER